MSTRIMSACWPLQMPPTAKAVLISLADNANDDGYCWPSITHICERTCFKKDAVINAIKWLEDYGLVSADRSNGRHTSYKISVDNYENQSVKATGRAKPPVGQTDLNQSVKTTNQSVKTTQPVGQTDTNRQEPSINRQGTVNARKRDLPDWMPASVWDSYRQHRRAIKKPMTENAERLNLEKLERWREKGYDPVEIVNDSIANGWQGLFEPKVRGSTASPNGGSKQAELERRNAEVMAQWVPPELRGEGNVIEGTCHAD